MFLRRVNLLKEGNIRAFKFGIYIAAIITVVGIYNFLVKTFLDPCCQLHTTGESLLKISIFFSYIIGIGIIFLIFLIFVKQIFDKIKPDKDISWRQKKESSLNMLFVAILVLNFGLLLVAQAPVKLIGCTHCEVKTTTEVLEKTNQAKPRVFNSIK